MVQYCVPEINQPPVSLPARGWREGDYKIPGRLQSVVALFARGWRGRVD
jgi:hypothetical protein